LSYKVGIVFIFASCLNDMFVCLVVPSAVLYWQKYKTFYCSRCETLRRWHVWSQLWSYLCLLQAAA